MTLMGSALPVFRQPTLHVSGKICSDNIDGVRAE